MSSAGMAATDAVDIASWLEHWTLQADGEPLKAHSRLLLPVRRGGEPDMLKIAHEPEERRGSQPASAALGR